ncbi:MAG: TetR/AcrR family transcriptional regulator [Mesorhizobium amorphae]|nr:MAG: TetR/AcrR family transcriptional regulator [Mesorhizobium amorphae]
MSETMQKERKRPTVPGRENASQGLSPKAQQIVAGARAAFHELGYEGTSVDEIARRAGVSKPTLYNHFADKQALYAAIFTMECQEQSKTFMGDHELSVECMEARLKQLARDITAYLLTDSAQAAFRNAVAESTRFPKLGSAYYDSGLGIGVKKVSALLELSIERKLLAIDDVELAAHQFIELCRSKLFYKKLFFVGETQSKKEIERVADAAAAMFMKAYRA